MSESLIAYWEAWLNDEIKIPMSIDGYIINYSMINTKSNEGIGDWICCNSIKKLISFIKFILLPSLSVTKVIGIQENKLFFDVSSYEETIEILEESEFPGYKEEIEEYNACFNELNRLEKSDASWNQIKDFLQYLNYSIDYKGGLLVNIQLFKNIKSVGKELINEYEEQDMIADLEAAFEMDKEGIEELFDNIEHNTFMLRKIGELLNNRSII